MKTCEPKGGWSAGIFYHFISEEGYDYSFLKQFMFKEPYELQTDVYTLGTSKDIESFKKKYHIIKIKELTLGPCGHNVFTILDDKFTLENGELTDVG